MSLSIFFRKNEYGHKCCEDVKGVKESTGVNYLDYVTNMTWRQRCLALTLLATAAGSMVLLSVNTMPLNNTSAHEVNRVLQLIPECGCGRRMDRGNIFPRESGEYSVMQ